MGTWASTKFVVYPMQKLFLGGFREFASKVFLKQPDPELVHFDGEHQVVRKFGLFGRWHVTILHPRWSLLLPPPCR